MNQQQTIEQIARNANSGTVIALCVVIIALAAALAYVVKLYVQSRDKIELYLREDRDNSDDSVEKLTIIVTNNTRALEGADRIIDRMSRMLDSRGKKNDA